MTGKPTKITYPAHSCKNKGKRIEVHRKVPENIQASSLEELRQHLDEEIDHDLQETYELTDERLVCTFWTLENETDEVERRIERLDRKLDEIKVPGENGEDKRNGR